MQNPQEAYTNQTIAADVRQPQVLEEMNGLGGLIMQHEELIAEFEKRLSPVLKNQPQDASGAPKQTQTLVPLAGEIRAAAERLSTLRDQYKSILQRIEL